MVKSGWLRVPTLLAIGMFAGLASAADYGVAVEQSRQGVVMPGTYPVSPAAHAQKSLDGNCLLDVAEAARRVGRGEMWFVDVRAAGVAGEMPAGAIRLPLYAVASKSFLQSKPVLLVGEGYRMVELAGQCSLLKSKGFRDVYVLYGGMPAWRQHFARSPQKARIELLQPGAFFHERDYRHWLVVDATGDASARQLFPEAIRVSSSKNGWLKAVESNWLRQVRENPPLVLLLGRDARAMARLQQDLEQLRQPMLLFGFADGLHGYRGFLRRQSLLWQQELNPPQQGNRCTY